MGAAVGIDLGTTNSVVAVLEGGEPQVVANQEGSRTTPSVVAFDKSGTVLVGEVAKRQSITNPDRTIRSIKREMGTNWSKEITTDGSGGEGDGSDGDKGGDGKQTTKKYTPEEISARILRKLKESAEAYLGTEVSSAVITVPAYFDDSQRTATQDAGKIAGLEVLRIINEPTAAALAYGMESEKDQTVLVFDLGGGTFDVSVLEIADEVFEVKATSGDSRLGGDDWDEKIIDWLVDSFKSDNGVDLSKDPMAMQRLKEAAEKAKIELSQKTEAQINLPFITANEAGPIHLDYNLSRAKFEAMSEDLLKRCEGPFKRAIGDSGLSIGDIDHVLLVGGSTRMPAVTQLVTGLTGREPHKGVNPDEVVAVGAAIQAGVLRGDVKDVLLLDVTPLSLGIETKGGVMTQLIERNTTIPTQRSEIFTTAAHNQPSVEIHVLQGEREMARYNKTLGRFDLVDIPPAPAGVPQIEVSFDIDVNGIVHVTAKDKATGNEQSITITGQSSLSKEDIDRMVKDAEEHAEEDRKLREQADLRNEADAMVFRTENFLKDQGDNLDGDVADDLRSKVDALTDALGGGDGAGDGGGDGAELDADRVKSATADLNDALQDAGKRLYEQAGGEAGGGDGAGADGGAGGGGQDYDGADSAFSDDSVMDAEIVDEPADDEAGR